MCLKTSLIQISSFLEHTFPQKIANNNANTKTHESCSLVLSIQRWRSASTYSHQHDRLPSKLRSNLALSPPKHRSPRVKFLLPPYQPRALHPREPDRLLTWECQINVLMHCMDSMWRPVSGRFARDLIWTDVESMSQLRNGCWSCSLSRQGTPFAAASSELPRLSRMIPIRRWCMRTNTVRGSS